MADGFLGRWSQRKRDVREGKPLQEPAPAPVLLEPAATPGSRPQAVNAQAAPVPATSAPAAAEPPPPRWPTPRRSPPIPISSPSWPVVWHPKCATRP
jgi:hypothetical protein